MPKDLQGVASVAVAVSDRNLHDGTLLQPEAAAGTARGDCKRSDMRQKKLKIMRALSLLGTDNYEARNLVDDRDRHVQEFTRPNGKKMGKK